MFKFRPSPEEKITLNLYTHAINQARRPEFYLYYGVPDTPLGRFELISVHLFLILRELKGNPLGQKLHDLACADIEMNLREMGTNDLGIGKQVKFLASQLQGRMHAYERGLNQEEALEDILLRNVYAGGGPSSSILAMFADYVRNRSAFLQGQKIKDGLVDFGSAPPVQ